MESLRMSTSRRGFLSRLFGGAVAAVVPPSWYLRQGLPVPLGEQPGLSNWTPITAPYDPGNIASYNAKFLACAEHFDKFIVERAQTKTQVWFDRIPKEVPYDPKRFEFTV
jgi:hypothetical protein